MDDAILYADGFEEAFIGYSWRFNDGPLATYDRDKCIKILTRDMGFNDAIEFFEFNTLGSWVGEKTPVFVSLGLINDDLIDESGR